MLGLALWHQRRLNRALAAERRAGTRERDRLQGLADRAQEDVRFYKDRAASLAEAQEQAAAFDRGYLGGMRHGADMTDVERMAYSLDQKQPGRLLRMARYHGQGGDASA